MCHMTPTPYLDFLGFTHFLESKFNFPDIIKVDKLICSLDVLLERSGNATNPIDKVVNFWYDLHDGAIAGYADLFCSYQLLYNIVEIVRLQGPATKDFMRAHLLLQHLYQMFPAPTIKEVRESMHLKFKSTGTHVCVFRGLK